MKHEANEFRLQDAAYQYPDGTLAVSEINLDIEQGARLALVGPNGSGKSTLIKLLSGLLQTSTGEAFYQDRPWSSAEMDQARLEIGILFQDPDDQLFGHTVLEDVSFGPRQQGLSPEKAEQAAKQALKQVGLEQWAYKLPHNLSFGQKKRVALAGLLAMKPRVLLLDEPTANLDPGQEHVFLDLLTAFSGTLICISHDLLFLYELCAQAAVLARGRIISRCSLSELVAQPRTLQEHGLDFSFRLNLMPAFSKAAPLEPEEPAAETDLSPGGPQQPSLVLLKEWGYHYPDGTPGLQDLDLSLRQGERVAVVGENGAGKSTLLLSLIGLLQGKGAYFFDGRLVTRRTRKSLWRRVGLVFQDCADQLFCSSVREEVSFGLRRLGFSRAETRIRLERSLDLVQLNGFEDRVPLHLSGGERKRLALACVLAMEPDLILLDEPSAGLDPQGEARLLEILQNLEASLVLVSHDLHCIKTLTKRTLVLHQGQILKDLSTRAFLQDERLAVLNGLAHTYRHRAGEAIRTLQHEHEQTHPHLHLHDSYPSPWGDAVRLLRA